MIALMRIQYKVICVNQKETENQWHFWNEDNKSDHSTEEVEGNGN